MPGHITQVDAAEKVIGIPRMPHFDWFAPFADQTIMFDVVDGLQKYEGEDTYSYGEVHPGQSKEIGYH